MLSLMLCGDGTTLNILRLDGVETVASSKASFSVYADAGMSNDSL